MNAVESNISISGNVNDLNDEEAQAAYELELSVFSSGVASLLGENRR